MTVTITTAAVFADGGPPAMQITVVGTSATPNPVPQGGALGLTRIHSDGSEHRVITAGLPRIGGGPWFDYHCPYNDPGVRYRAAAGSASVLSEPDQLTSESAWLVHPSQPELSVQPFTVRNLGARSTSSRAGSFTPPGEDPIWVTDGHRSAPSGSILFEVVDDQAVMDLTADDQVLLINTPGDGWRVKWQWVQPGDISYVNEGRAFWATELVTLPYEPSQEPSVELVNLWNAGRMAEEFRAAGIKAGQVSAMYANAAALITDTRLA